LSPSHRGHPNHGVALYPLLNVAHFEAGKPTGRAGRQRFRAGQKPAGSSRRRGWRLRPLLAQITRLPAHGRFGRLGAISGQETIVKPGQHR
jgi:hypothetical protein